MNYNEIRLWLPSPCLFRMIDKIEDIREKKGLPKYGVAIDLACGSGLKLLFISQCVFL